MDGSFLTSKFFLLSYKMVFSFFSSSQKFLVLSCRPEDVSFRKLKLLIALFDKWPKIFLMCVCVKIMQIVCHVRSYVVLRLLCQSFQLLINFVPEAFGLSFQTCDVN